MHLLVASVCVIALLALGFGLFALWRFTVARAWRRAARYLRCVEERGSFFQPGGLQGTHHGRPLLISTATSYEDGPAYYHTAVHLQCVNPGGVVLGLRRKSVLEQFVSRKEVVATPSGDGDLDALFFLVCNDPDAVPCLLPPSLCARLKKLDDIEVYVGQDQVTVRRSGERRQARELIDMVELADQIADALESLPERHRTPAEVFEDQKLIQRGV